MKLEKRYEAKCPYSHICKREDKGNYPICGDWAEVKIFVYWRPNTEWEYDEELKKKVKKKRWRKGHHYKVRKISKHL